MTVLRSGSASDTGLVRSSNQDLALEAPNLYAVADGMGGHAGGEVAARLAVEALQAAFGRHPTGSGLAEAVDDANLVVWNHSDDHPELRGMGTTLTAMGLVNEDGRDLLALVNVGDSRTYRYHDGELEQVTADHSLAEEMVRTGELTAAEAAVHPHRHILTRALGVGPEVDVDLWRIRPERGDRYLLCSDGLTNELGNNQIGEILATMSDPQQAADLLVRAARDHGGSDNITVVVVDVVLGEQDSGSTPAVSSVTTDFIVPRADGAEPGAPPRQPLAVPEAPLPSRRDQRKAKRRERRVRRGRRLVTVRTLIFVVLLGGILVGAYQAVRWFDTNSYFVGLDNQELVIYQGRIGGFLWYHPVEYQRTGVTTADVPSQDVDALRQGVEKSSPGAARKYVKQLVDEENLFKSSSGSQASGGLPPAPPITTVPPSTTTTTAAH